MTRLKPTLLAIEDDPDFLKSLELVLSRFGLNVKGVTTPEEFLAVVGTVDPNLFLIDLQLGESSGLDLIDQLRNKLGYRVPIIAISGAKQMASIAHALEIGANDYIIKPLDRTFLASKLSRFLKTEEMDQHKSAYRELSSPAKGRLTLDVEITEMDELGVHLVTGSLIPKGTVFKLDAALFPLIEGVPKECLMTVTSTTLDATMRKYHLYAEFDGVDLEFLQGIRRWLAEGSG